MKEVIYIDTLIAENTFMNFLLLYSAGRFAPESCEICRIITAAFLGSFYSLITFIQDLNFLNNIIFKFVVSVLMISASLRPRNIRDMIKLLFMFYLSAFFIFGTVSFMCLPGAGIESTDSTFSFSSMSLKKLFIIAISCSILLKFGMRFYENYISLEKRKVQLVVHNEGKSCTINALIDTGNTLKDPLTGCNVIIASIDVMKPLLPYEIGEKLEKTKKIEELSSMIIASAMENRIRVIPYRALGNERGLLVALKMDYVEVRKSKEMIIVKNPLIGLYEKPLAEDGSFDALAYPEILKGGSAKNERL